MNDKKHIDRLFQEGLKDFEAIPNDAVWNRIEAELKKNKKRRVIPIWWRYAGVAALLLLLLTVGISYFNNENTTQTNQVVDTESTITNDSDNLNRDALNDALIKEDIVTANHNDNNNTEEKVSQSNASTESSIIETTVAKSINNNASHLNKEPHIALIKEKVNKTNQKGKNPALININNAKKTIINTSQNNNSIAKSKKETTNTLAKNNTKENTLTIEEAIDKTKNLFEEENLNRWSVTPNAAPVYFNSMGDGSSIDPQFNSNSKTGEVNMSYGLSASYAVNKKLSIRSGVNKVTLGYNTNNIVVYRSVGSSSSKRSLQNVNASSSSNAENMSITSEENFITSTSPESFGATNTSINQSLGYIEIPIEIQYALLNKKLGINVISGFSSFILNNNEIYSEAEGGSRTFLGKANNINKISYSANFGLGLNYQVSKKIDLNLEPMFKYQINTFNNTSGDFKPYFIGVYTGFAIKF